MRPNLYHHIAFIFPGHKTFFAKLLSRAVTDREFFHLFLLPVKEILLLPVSDLVHIIVDRRAPEIQRRSVNDPVLPVHLIALKLPGDLVENNAEFLSRNLCTDRCLADGKRRLRFLSAYTKACLICIQTVPRRRFCIRRYAVLLFFRIAVRQKELLRPDLMFCRRIVCGLLIHERQIHIIIASRFRFFYLIRDR